MRPRKLTMQAFGSYGKKTEIDFSGLRQNLFLITGDTGGYLFQASITLAMFFPANDVRSHSVVRSPILCLLLSIPPQLIAYIPGLSENPSIVGYPPQKGQGFTPIFSAYFFNIIPTVLLLALVISLNVICSSMIRFIWIKTFWIPYLQLIYIHLEYLIYIQLHRFAYHSNIPHHISKLFFQVFNM